MEALALGSSFDSVPCWRNQQKKPIIGAEESPQHPPHVPLTQPVLPALNQCGEATPVEEGTGNDAPNAADAVHGAGIHGIILRCRRNSSTLPPLHHLPLQEVPLPERLATDKHRGGQQFPQGPQGHKVSTSVNLQLHEDHGGDLIDDAAQKASGASRAALLGHKGERAQDRSERPCCRIQP